MTDAERTTTIEHVAYWTALAKGSRARLWTSGRPRGGVGGGRRARENFDAQRVGDEDPAARSPHGFRTEILPMLQVTPDATDERVRRS
jgi:hypothetical protein